MTARTRTWDLERRIRRMWESASPHDLEQGSRWYEAAYTKALELAYDWDLPLRKVVGVIAAISPGCEWKQNVEQAERLIAWWVNDRHTRKPPQISTYTFRNVQKAIDILGGATPSWPRGPKVTAFFRLIMSAGTVEDMCADTHALDIAYGKRRGSIRGRRYKETEVRRARLAYQRLAGKLGIMPSTLQAVTWLTHKRRKAERRA